jgi:hypothetical protein
LCLNTRTPQKHLMSRTTGAIGLTEQSMSESTHWTELTVKFITLTKVVVALRNDQPALFQQDQTPFRITPNVQDFITPGGIEGLLTSAMLALSRGLLEPEVSKMDLILLSKLILILSVRSRNKCCSSFEMTFCCGTSFKGRTLSMIGLNSGSLWQILLKRFWRGWAKCLEVEKGQR